MPTTADRPTVQRLVRDAAATVVEVLPSAEYEWAHLPGALHVPLKDWDAEAVAARLPLDRPVVVYCHDSL